MTQNSWETYSENGCSRMHDSVCVCPHAYLLVLIRV